MFRLPIDAVGFRASSATSTPNGRLACCMALMAAPSSTICMQSSVAKASGTFHVAKPSPSELDFLLASAAAS